MQSTEQYLNIKEAAVYLGINQVTLSNWIRQDVAPPYIKYGKRKKFRLDDLADYKANGKKG